MPAPRPSAYISLAPTGRICEMWFRDFCEYRDKGTLHEYLSTLLLYTATQCRPTTLNLTMFLHFFGNTFKMYIVDTDICGSRILVQREHG